MYTKKYRNSAVILGLDCLSDLTYKAAKVNTKAKDKSKGRCSKSKCKSRLNIKKYRAVLADLHIEGSSIRLICKL